MDIGHGVARIILLNDALDMGGIDAHLLDRVAQIVQAWSAEVGGLCLLRRNTRVGTDLTFVGTYPWHLIP